MEFGAGDDAQIAQTFLQHRSRGDKDDLFESLAGSDRLEVVAFSSTSSHYSERIPPLKEHTTVSALRDFRAMGVHAGDTGTIVHVYEDGGYEVEFTKGRSRPVVVTVEDSDVEALVRG